MGYHPRITVVTISYNSRETIERTIQSVVSQDYDNKEYIIIDGASSDGSIDIISKYRSQIDYFISEKDEGISDAFNKGILLSTGDLIVCINSDDYLLPNVLSIVAAVYDGKTDIYSCNELLWDEKNDIRYVLRPSTNFPTMPFFKQPAHQGAFISRKLLEDLGGYDLKLRYAMDLDLLMRATRKGAVFKHVDIVASVFKLGGATNQSIFKKRSEYLYIVRKNGGSWLQAHFFYAFLVFTQTTKKLLRLTGIDWVRKLRYKKIQSLILLLTAACQAVASSLPIIAYMGPVVRSLTAEEYKEMADGGFTHSLNIYNTLEEASSDLVTAGSAGIKVFVHTPQVLDTPQQAAAKLKYSPAFAGYFVADEPSYSELTRLKDVIEKLRKADSRHNCYVNLHPYYDNRQLSVVGTNTYEDYLRKASDMQITQLSFDYYPVKDGRLRSTWYLTLGQVREEAVRTQRPFWGYILTVPHNGYPQPTLSMLRLQAYVNLAYGIQALQFFTYRTPNDPRYDFKDAIIGRDGRKTATYGLVKELNKEVKAVWPLFENSQISGIYHLGDIPLGSKRLSTPPVNIKKLKVKGKLGILVSVLSKGGHTYMVVVNKDYQFPAEVSITTLSMAVKHLTKKLLPEKIDSRYTISAGDMECFLLQ